VSAATNVHVLPFVNRPGPRSADHGLGLVTDLVTNSPETGGKHATQ
jgi:hypothetical protein